MSMAPTLKEVFILHGKPTLLGAVSGALAGLVAITPACGFVSAMSSMIIGLMGGAICFFSVSIMKAKLGYDDSFDAFGVHGVGGTWGALATGLFASKAVNQAGSDGLFFGNPGQMTSQIIAIVASYAIAIVGTYVNCYVPANTPDVLKGSRHKIFVEKGGK